MINLLTEIPSISIRKHTELFEEYKNCYLLLDKGGQAFSNSLKYGTYDFINSSVTKYKTEASAIKALKTSKHFNLKVVKVSEYFQRVWIFELERFYMNYEARERLKVIEVVIPKNYLTDMDNYYTSKEDALKVFLKNYNPIIEELSSVNTVEVATKIRELEALEKQKQEEIKALRDELYRLEEYTSKSIGQKLDYYKEFKKNNFTNTQLLLED